MDNRPKCIVVLSTKSSGSSALQALICKYGGGRHVQHTRHGEFETLYWTKAASVLGLPQVRLPDSEVPIPPAVALRDLRTLLTQNAPDFRIPAELHALVFNGWRALQEAHAPVFVEKSPHHLHQRVCLDLLLQAADYMPDVDFHFVGLVRNPMDVMYSAWTRWRIPPERFQHFWRTAYENLEHFKHASSGRLTIIKYEDLADTPATASDLLNQLGLRATLGADTYIHASSKNKWNYDDAYGFQLDGQTLDVARRFGYATTELENNPRVMWPIRRAFQRAVHRAVRRPAAAMRRYLHRGRSGVRS